MTGSRRTLPLFALGALLTSCSMLGEESPFPDAVSTSGVGPFRILTAAETGTNAQPVGTVLPVLGFGVDGGAVVEEHLYYAGAPLLSVRPDRDPTLPPGSIDWAQFEARRIYHSPPGSGLAFGAGAEVLAASEAWEGADLFDPCPVVLPDGRMRLYYAAAGGIGVAEASAVGAPLARVGAAPVLGVRAGAVAAPRSPAFVELPGVGAFLYFDEGDGIYVATTTDGLLFTRVDADPSTPEMDPLDLEPIAEDPDGRVEVRRARPGATVGEMSTGRRTVRLYFERWMDDDARFVAFAASADGLHFERSDAIVVSVEEGGAPFPYADGRTVTRLYLTQAHEAAAVQVRALMGAVSPADFEYPGGG